MLNKNDLVQQDADRRRTQRMSIPFPIEVCGRELRGTVFHDKTTTIDVNEHGCKFHLAYPIGRGDLVTIRHVMHTQTSEENAPMLFQVVWTEGGETGWTVGAVKLQDKRAWPMTFPPQSSSELQHASPSRGAISR